MDNEAQDRVRRGSAAEAGSGGAALREVDCRHLSCPLPVLRLRRTLSQLGPGARVMVVATDPVSVVDIPHFCREEGHVLLDQSQRVTGHGLAEHTFIIEKAKSGAS